VDWANAQTLAIIYLHLTNGWQEERMMVAKCKYQFLRISKIKSDSNSNKTHTVELHLEDLSLIMWTILPCWIISSLGLGFLAMHWIGLVLTLVQTLNKPIYMVSLVVSLLDCDCQPKVRGMQEVFKFQPGQKFV